MAICLPLLDPAVLPAGARLAVGRQLHRRDDPIRQQPKLARVRVCLWLDFAGQRVLYQSLAAGQTLYQATYASRRWVITTEGDQVSLAWPEPVGSRSIAEIQ